MVTEIKPDLIQMSGTDCQKRTSANLGFPVDELLYSSTYFCLYVKFKFQSIKLF